MKKGIDIFEQLIAMYLTGEIENYALEIKPKIDIDMDEIEKAGEMYE